MCPLGDVELEFLMLTFRVKYHLPEGLGLIPGVNTKGFAAVFGNNVIIIVV